MMKLKLVLVFLVINFVGHSQSFFGVRYNNILIGNNLGVMYEQDFKKLKLGLGLSILLDDNSYPSPSTVVFANQAFAHNFKERIGLNFSSLFEIYKYKENYNINIGYRFFLSHSGIRSTALIPAAEISAQVGEKVYYVELVDFSAYYSLEHYLQFNFETKLMDRIYFSQSFGAGFGASYDLDEKLINAQLPNRFFLGQSWEVSWFFSMGLKYQFK